jgi:hypothetical protein
MRKYRCILLNARRIAMFGGLSDDYVRPPGESPAMMTDHPAAKKVRSTIRIIPS